MELLVLGTLALAGHQLAKSNKDNQGREHATSYTRPTVNEVKKQLLAHFAHQLEQEL